MVGSYGSVNLTWDDSQVQLPVHCLDHLNRVILVLRRSQDLRMRLFHSMLGVIVAADTEAFTRG